MWQPGTSHAPGFAKLPSLNLPFCIQGVVKPICSPNARPGSHLEKSEEFPGLKTNQAAWLPNFN